MTNRIVAIKGREILNARGKPTVEAVVVTENGISARASVPSGTSTGKYEAFELYDGGLRFQGFGTRNAAANVSGKIAQGLKGLDVTDQSLIDKRMCEIDATQNKCVLGANAILAVSVAVAKSGALTKQIPLYNYFGNVEKPRTLPDLTATVISGGSFSPSGLEFEDYIYVIQGLGTFAERLEALVVLRRELETILRKKLGDFPEDGGALAAPLSSSREAFDYMLENAKQCGFEKNVTIGIDAASDELFDSVSGMYTIKGGIKACSEELLEYYVQLCHAYPLTFLEDAFEQDDFESFAKLKSILPNIQIVGDDLFATNMKRLQTGIEYDCANGLLLKINQIGTISEALETAMLANKNGYSITVSLRSGETADDFIADFAVGINAKQVKFGSPVRLERNIKYNRLLAIEAEIM
jgi:enolase